MTGEVLISSLSPARSNIVARGWAGRWAFLYAISWQFLIDILYIVWRSHRIAFYHPLPLTLSLLLFLSHTLSLSQRTGILWLCMSHKNVACIFAWPLRTEDGNGKHTMWHIVPIRHGSRMWIRIRMRLWMRLWIPVSFRSLVRSSLLALNLRPSVCQLRCIRILNAPNRFA